MGLMARRKLELDQKLASLQLEIGEWSDRTTREPMRRHYSQVVRLNRVITSLLETMTAAGLKAVRVLSESEGVLYVEGTKGRS